MATAILLGVALATTSHPTPATPPAPRGSQAWAGSAVPTIINLIDDVRAVQDATAAGATHPASQLDQDAARLRVDLAVAQALPAPPSASFASHWAQALTSLTVAQHDLTAALAQPSADALGQARSQLETGGNSLLQIAEAIQTAG